MSSFASHQGDAVCTAALRDRAAVGRVNRRSRSASGLCWRDNSHPLSAPRYVMVAPDDTYTTALRAAAEFHGDPAAPGSPRSARRRWGFGGLFRLGGRRLRHVGGDRRGSIAPDLLNLRLGRRSLRLP